MLRSLKRWGSIGLAGILVVGGLTAAAAGLDGGVNRSALKNNDLTRLRAEALTLFPRGSRLDAATAQLVSIGFACEPIPHPLPDISGPSLRCASNGRGYPNYPAVTVILLTRNGLISDVDVWNIMARADGEPDDIDFTAIGSSQALPARLRRPADADPGADDSRS